MHEGVKYNYGQYHHQSTSKGNLAKHKRAVHEGVKYPCLQCGHQFSSKGSLDKHNRAVHEGVKYPCGQCGHQKDIFLSIKGLCMKDTSTLVDNVIISQLQMEILLLTI